MKKRYLSISIFIILILSFIALIGSTYVKNEYLTQGVTGRAAAPIGGNPDYCMGDCFTTIGINCPSDYYLYFSNYPDNNGACGMGENCCIPNGGVICSGGSGLCYDGAICGINRYEANDDDFSCSDDQVCCVPEENCNGLNCNPPMDELPVCGDGICEGGETCVGCIDDCEGLGNDGGDTVCGDDYYCSRYDFFGNENPGCQLACEQGWEDPAVCFHEQAGCNNFGYEYTQPYSSTACGTHAEACCEINPLRDNPPESADGFCGNGFCELSKGESCDECYIDCQGLKADCGFEEVCMFDGNDPTCVVSCSNNFPCGCFERDCPQNYPPYNDLNQVVEFDYLDITGENPDEYMGDSIAWNCWDLHEVQPEPHYEYWRECSYDSDTRGFMEVIESNTPDECNDGSPEGGCSLTQPLYCINDELVNSCSNCGCSHGYYCDVEGEVCLTNQSYIDLNQTTPQLSPGDGEEENFALWRQLQKTYGISQEGSAVSATVLRKFAKGDDKGVLRSPGTLITEIVKTKDVDSILKLSPESIERSNNKIEKTSDIFESGDSDEIEDLLFEGDEDANIGLIGNVITQAAAPENETCDPDIQECVDLSPPTEIEPIEIPCVAEIDVSCIGNGVECCDGLVCTQGVCRASSGVTPVPQNISGGIVEETEEDSLTELVAVTVQGESGGISVSEYETHPVEVESLEIPNAVTFGFYDIKSENEVGASLSFEVLNDLLVVSQIAAIGLYRLTDEGWESLPLEEVVFSADRTRFTFNTEGFSFFTLKGVKEGINFKTATEQDSSLWSVYRRSFTPGFALVEFFIGDKDTIIFGIFDHAPLIDLGLAGFS
jgi:hypothetical protein